MSYEQFREQCIKIIEDAKVEVSTLNGKRLVSIPELRLTMIERINALPLPDSALAHGNRSDRYLLANARRIAKAAYKPKPNWVLAMQLFATGSNSAIQICKDAGIDPYGLIVGHGCPSRYTTKSE